MDALTLVELLPLKRILYDINDFQVPRKINLNVNIIFNSKNGMTFLINDIKILPPSKINQCFNIKITESYAFKPY